MGIKDSCGSFDSAIKKLLEAVTAVVDLSSIGRLINKQIKGVAAPQTVAEEMILASAEVSTFSTAPLLLEEPIVASKYPVLKEEVPTTECPEPEEPPMLVDQCQTVEPSGGAVCFRGTRGTYDSGGRS